MLKPKKCKKCGREFITYYDTSQFCSKNCFYKSGKPRKPCSVKAKQKISDAKKGKKFSKEHAEKIRVRATGLTGIKARHWLGDKVGKAGVHILLYKIYGAPKNCDHCHKTDRKNYDWACKDHKYRRDRDNFLRLCRSCHRKYDIKENGHGKHLLKINLMK